MRTRKDPLVPLLGSAVTLLVIGAVIFVFYPALEQWRARDSIAVVGHPPSPADSVPVWACGSEAGIALVLDAAPEPETMRELGAALEGGPYQFLRLSVLNFSRETPYLLTLPDAGLVSPEGGAPALPAHLRVRADAPKRLRMVLEGLGARESVEVAMGQRAQFLLLVEGEIAARTGFVNGALQFTRCSVERGALAAWRAQPDWQRFTEFSRVP